MRCLAFLVLSIFPSSAAIADIWGGFIDGAIDGAIIGGIIDGEEGAVDGAAIGGTIGAIDGAQREIDRERDRYYFNRRLDRYDTRRAVPPKKKNAAQNLVVEVQLALRRLGYNPGPADGIAGQATARAVQAYKSDWGLPQDNMITPDLLRHMRQHGG